MTYHYDIDGQNFALAGEASSAIKHLLQKLSVDPHVIRRVAIAMYEAEINTVIHGGGGCVDVEVTPLAIRMTFRDNGPGIADINRAMQAGFSTATPQIRELGFGAGMGLPNIQKYTDEMKVISAPGKGTTLKLAIHIPQP